MLALKKKPGYHFSVFWLRSSVKKKPRILKGIYPDIMILKKLINLYTERRLYTNKSMYRYVGFLNTNFLWSVFHHLLIVMYSDNGENKT